MFQKKSHAFLFALLSMLVGPVILRVLSWHVDELKGVYELAPALVAGLSLFFVVYGLKRTWRIYRAERDEIVRERVRQRMRRRFS